MQSNVTINTLTASEAAQAQAVLRRCVHCGFCNSACPTYLQLGEENNGPRGRIYQMKTYLEGGSVNATTLKNLDQCLTCQACETACPSGVQYSHLLDIARPQIAAAVRRPLKQRLHRRLALLLLLRPRLLRLLLTLAQPLRSLLPRKFQPYLGLSAETSVPAPPPAAKKRIVLFDGCVQSAITPATNAHTAAVCARLGIAVSEEKRFCCGALQLHLEDKQAALARIRANVDRLHRQLQNGAECIVSTASGCGRMLADYGRLLAEDKQYAERAQAVSAAHKDIAELLLAEESLAGLRVGSESLSFHCPCTLQNAQGQADAVPALFARLGANLQQPADGGKCCGSAGFYSQEHPELAQKLRDERLAQLAEHKPAHIVTANIGCQLHLQGGTTVPVTHWIEQVRIDGGG